MGIWTGNVTGYIPEKLTAVCKEPVKVGAYENAGTEVVPAFIVDASNAKTLETAQYWASSRSPLKKSEVPCIGLDNKPIRGIRILGLDVRDEGGRAYKVAIPTNERLFYVDLREDPFLEGLLKYGITPGGVLGGEYIWAVVGSQIKLILVGSKIHQDLVGLTATRNDRKLKPADFVVGTIYAGRSNKPMGYLGTVDTLEWSVKSSAWEQVTHHLWIDLEYMRRSDTPEKVLDDVLNPNTKYPSTCALKLTLPKSLTHTTGTFEIPENMHTRIKVVAIRDLQRWMKDYNPAAFQNPSGKEYCYRSRRECVRSKMPLIAIKAGENPILPSDIKKYLDTPDKMKEPNPK